MSKKSYPGGFRLTLATARRLAVQEFGTAKGLEPDRGTCLEGFFKMQMGNLVVSINPDLGMSGCIVVRAGLCTASHTCIGYFNRETLEPDYDAMDKYERREKREALETWVGEIGPDACHKRIDEVWEGGAGVVEITVTMTPDDFMEFMEWKKDKTASEKALREVGKNLENMAGMVLKTLEECGKEDKPEFRIENQAEAAKLVEAAYEVF